MTTPRIAELVDQLGAKKAEFLDDTIGRVKEYIRGQGSDCVAVVGLSAAGEVEKTYRLQKNVWQGREFVPALVNFCRKKPYDGRELDSLLTRPVVDVVVQGFEQFYQGNADLLSAALLKTLTEDRTVLDGIVQAVVDTRLAGMAVGQARSFVVGQVAHEVSRRASDLIVHQIQAYTQSTLAGGGSHVAAVGKQSLGDAAAASLAKTVAAVIVKLIAAGMGPLLVKLLATAAFKTLVLTALKKFVVAAIIGVVIHSVASALGISSAAAWAFILAPVVLGILAHQIYTFPGKLADKVGEKLRAELDANFAAVNATILEKLFAGLHTQAMTAVANGVATDPQVIAALDQLLEQMAG